MGESQGILGSIGVYWGAWGVLGSLGSVGKFGECWGVSSGGQKATQQLTFHVLEMGSLGSAGDPWLELDFIQSRSHYCLGTHGG